MPSLLEKIAANAESRLKLPAGRLPSRELPRYKGFLKVETHRLKLRHRAGGGGREMCHARAALLDALLCHLWESSKRSLSEQAQREFPAISLVALGGYGRGELNPHSDIDFMFLHNRQVVSGSKPLPHLSRVMDGLLYTLWDIGLKIGYSVRSIEECIDVANSDMLSKTSLIEARLITGDRKHFEKLQKAVLAKCVLGYEEDYIRARVEDQRSRHAKYGDSPTMQEPNIKSGCGGLRDYHNLLWMAFFKYQARSLEELENQKLISNSERRQLEQAYDFLLRVRNELHYHTERPTDVLGRSLQPAVAHNLGFTDRSPTRRIEKLMKTLFTRARCIYLITSTIEERLALQAAPAKQPFLQKLIRKRAESPPPTVDGFRFVNGYILPASSRVFRDQPRRLMRVFLHAQQRGLRLHPDLAQMVRNQLSLVDRAFLKDGHVQETFLEILNQRGNVARTLREMHAVDLLGKYIPEFGRLTCLVQHEFYHQYAADEHTLMCLAKVDKIWDAREEPYSHYTVTFQALDRPYVLYLALLLHDVGKALGQGGHCETGAEMAGRVARRMRLDGSTTHTLQRIIRHHLLLAQVSQRRDLDDPTVIRQVAHHVHDMETLDLLTLHTFADSVATSDKLWNGFKDSLLWTLHQKTRRLLGAGTEFVMAESRQRELLSEQVGRLLPGSITDEELEVHFKNLPARYFTIFEAGEIVEHLKLTHRFLQRQMEDGKEPLKPSIYWAIERDRGYASVTVCTWDRLGLFTKIAGSLSASGMNILGTQAFTRADGIALDMFTVVDARSGALPDRETREGFNDLITRSLLGEDLKFISLIAKRKGGSISYEAIEGEPLPTTVRFDNEVSDNRTVIEVETENRVGLLYTISQQLTGLQLNISVAKICTEKGAAIDTFYVCEPDGGKVTSPERLELIRRKLTDAISSLSKRDR